MPPSHDHSTRSQYVKMINWVFYHPGYPQQQVFTAYPYKIKDGDLDLDMLTWIPKAFASDIRNIYDFNPDETRIRVAKPNTAVDALDVDHRWARNITDPLESFRFLPPILVVRDLIDMLDVINNTSRLHLVVTARRAGEMEPGYQGEARDTVCDIDQTYSRYHNALTKNPKTPSIAAKSGEYAIIQTNPALTIYDGRKADGGRSTAAPPVHIFHPIFETFMRRINDPNVQPPPSMILETRELMRSTSIIADTEVRKAEHICIKLSRIIGQVFHGIVNFDKTSPDAAGLCDIDGIATPFAMIEIKREYGDTGYDPATQASFSFQRNWQSQYASTMRQRCCCPTFILVVGGPWFGVLGGVFTDKFIVQRLTDLMWTAESSLYEDSRIYKTARVFYALKTCLQDLRVYYQSVKDLPVEVSEPELEPTNPSRFFPYSTSFTAADPDSGQERTWRFKYLYALETCSACVTYRAEILDEPLVGEQIVVKFVTRYGEGVHQFLEHRGHAPKLYYFGPLRNGGDSYGNIWPGATAPPLGLHFGPLKMVVMEYIRPSEAPPDSEKQVSDVIKQLHNKGFVFGDLRKPNVLFDDDKNVKFIDFDWAGCYDQNVTDEELSGREIPTQESTHPFARYPLALSRSVDWALPVDKLELNFIRPSHDLEMIRKHFR